MNIETPFVIISPALAGVSDVDNERRDVFMDKQLTSRGLDYIHVSGVYKGVKEPAFLVLLGSREDDIFPALVRLAKAYDQESVLYVDANRQAYLHFVDTGNTEPLGKWREIYTVNGRTAYTEYMGRYFAAG